MIHTTRKFGGEVSVAVETQTEGHCEVLNAETC